MVETVNGGGMGFSKVGIRADSSDCWAKMGVRSIIGESSDARASRPPLPGTTRTSKSALCLLAAYLTA